METNRSLLPHGPWKSRQLQTSLTPQADFSLCCKLSILNLVQNDLKCAMLCVALKGNRGLEDPMPGRWICPDLPNNEKWGGRPDGGGLEEAESHPYRQFITLSQRSRNLFTSALSPSCGDRCEPLLSISQHTTVL